MRRFFLSTMVAIAALMPAWAFASEQEAAQQIADGIRQSGRLKDYSIGVKYENGTAYLMGRVASEDQAQTAMDLAKTMPNVTDVVNELEIKPSAKKDFAVQPTAGASRRSMSRDELVFGASAEQPVAPAAEPAQLEVPQTASRPHLHHHRRSTGVGSGATPISTGGAYSGGGAPIPVGVATQTGNLQRVAYDQPNMPCYAWPAYASHPNYAAVTYPQQYSAAAWPYIGPFYPYPQVPLGWRRVCLEWDDGWWWLDFNDHCKHFRR
jgi:hypothetical protein